MNLNSVSQPHRLKVWLLLALAWLLAMPPGRAADRYVPSAQYPTVRAAYAAANDGDTIRVTGLRLENPGQFLPEKRVNIVPANGVATISANIRPPNDDFENRIALTGEDIVAYGVNYAATSQPGEPVGGKSIWWTWTAGSSCGVRISTSGSSFDTILNVFTGATLNNPKLLATNDNANPATVASAVSFTTQAGDVLQIAVTGKNDSYGEVVLHIDPLDSTPNDLFSNPIITSGPLVSSDECNTAAGKEPGEPNHAGEPGGRSLWWRWTAPYSSLATITATTVDDLDTVLAVYQGSSLPQLQQVAANDDAELGKTYSRASFQARAGAEYRIAIDGKRGAGSSDPSDSVLKLDIHQPPPIAILSALTIIDEFISDGSVSVSFEVVLANNGTAPSRPLRLRLLATDSLATNAIPDLVLATFHPLNPATVSTGIFSTNQISAVLPVHGSGCRTVFVSVEELATEVWILQDAKKIYVYGSGGECGNTQNVEGGPVLLNTAPTLGGRWEPTTLNYVRINVPDTLAEGTTQKVSGTARFSTGYEQAFTDTSWASSLFSISTNGLLSLGSVTQNTFLTITAPYIFGGATNSTNRVITVQNLPPPVLSGAVLGSNGVPQLTVRGVPGRRHVLQRSTNLLTWTDLLIQTAGTNGQFNFFDSAPPPARQRFYRASEVP